MKVTRGLVLLAAGTALSLSGMAASHAATVEMTIAVGGEMRTVHIELDEAAAPQSSANFKKLCSEGFYNGIAVHRVIPNYIVQAGDPLTKDAAQKMRWGTGGPGYKVPAELGQKHLRGAVAAARLSDPANPSKASSGSQFYICLRDIPALDGEYTVFGRVTKGLDDFDEIARARTDANDIPIDRIEIISTKVIEASEPAPAPSLTGTGTASEPPSAATETTAGAPVSVTVPGAVADASTGRSSLPPMPDLNISPSEPAPAPTRVSDDNTITAAFPPVATAPAENRGLPPMPDLTASSSPPSPTPPAASSPDPVTAAPPLPSGRGLPPMPNLNIRPSDPVPTPAPVSGGNGDATFTTAPEENRGLPPMPDLSQPSPLSSSSLPNSTGFGPADTLELPSSSGGSLATEPMPSTSSAPVPPPSVPAGAPTPASQTKPMKERGFFGKLIRRFW